MDERKKVIISDSDMSFWRKIGFTIRKEVAAIPAAFMLIIAGFVLMGIFGKVVLLR